MGLMFLLLGLFITQSDNFNQQTETGHGVSVASGSEERALTEFSLGARQQLPQPPYTALTAHNELLQLYQQTSTPASSPSVALNVNLADCQTPNQSTDAETFNRKPITLVKSVQGWTEPSRQDFEVAFHRKILATSGGYAVLLPEFGLLSPHPLDAKTRADLLVAYSLRHKNLVNQIAQLRQDSLRRLYDILDKQQKEKLARKTGMTADAWCQVYDRRALPDFLPLLDCTMPLQLDATKTDTDDFRRLTKVLLTWLHEIEMFAQDDSDPRDTRVQYSLHNWMRRWPKDKFIEEVYVLCVADFASGSEEGTDHSECLQLRQLAKRVEQRFRDFEVKLGAESEGPTNRRIAAIVRDKNYEPFLKSLAALHNANAETDTSELYHQYLTANGDCPFTLGEVSRFDDRPSPFVLDIYAKPSRISQQFQATKDDFPAVSGLENRLQNLARMRLYAITDARSISERIDAQDAYLHKVRELLSPEQTVIFFNKLYASHGPIYYFSKPSVQEEFSIKPEQIAAMRTRGKILANEIRDTRNLALRNNLKRLIDALPEDIVQSICDKTQMTTTQLIQAMNDCPEEAFELKYLNSQTESALGSNKLGK